MSSLTYKDSGVDITKGNQLIEKIKPIAKSTLGLAFWQVLEALVQCLKSL